MAVNSSIANSVLPDILRAFRKRFPEVRLVLREVTSYQQVQELRDGQIDIGFERLPSKYGNDPALNFMTILQEPLVVALPETHPLAALPQIPLKALE